jgi:2-keto-4-pentenoate hydratase/2-oxohepta-3-ene-1,7-dioic acid hydratase in catechol pathway
MKYARYRSNGIHGVAVSRDGVSFHGCLNTEAAFPGDLDSLVAKGSAALVAAATSLLRLPRVDLDACKLLAPLAHPGKILCVGLNYRAHAAEGGVEPPTYPTLFARFTSSLIGPRDSIVRPRVSEQLDFEGEMVAVIGKPGRDIAIPDALDHIVGYSVFNDGTLRDYQRLTPQWTVGKNFDGTGSFGPYLVSADELPPGAAGLHIETRLNGLVVQSASTSDLIFDVAKLVSTLSEVLTLEAGDIIVTGTPSGVGAARKPPLWMKPGDVCEVEIERIGVLRNPIIDATPR